MASLTDSLGKQVGPLPLGAWVAVVGGGLAIAIYTSKQRVAERQEEQVDTGSPPGVGEGPGTPGFIPSPVPTPAPAQGYADNEAWGFAAVSWLIQNNMGSPSQASMAIRKFLDGDLWTADDDRMIRAALKALGPPPIIPLGGGVIPAPPKPPTQPSPTTPPTNPGPRKPVPPTPPRTPPGTWVQVGRWPAWNSTLSGIARRYYGSAAAWPRIRAANWKGVRRPDGSLGMITNSDRLTPGWRLWVPK